MVLNVLSCIILGFFLFTLRLYHFHSTSIDARLSSYIKIQGRATTVASYSCSLSDFEALKNLSIVSNPTMLAEESRCPKNTWLNEMLSLKSNTKNKSFVGISVGCNTGIDAIGLCRLLSRNLAFSKSIWLSMMEKYSRKRLIAACRSENTIQKGLHAELDELRLTPSMKQKPVSFHCIEPLGSTYNALEKSSEFLGLEKFGFQVHKYVISNASGVVWFPRGKPGTEYLGAYACSDAIVKSCVRTEMLTLDDFTLKYLYPEVIIDILTIDAEGYDFRVLKGASNVLRRTKYLEFEYHSSWKKEETLRDAIRYVQSKGFVCYFAGNKRLFKISHGCWIDNFEFRLWSNVVCVSTMEKKWVETTEKYFRNVFV